MKHDHSIAIVGLSGKFPGASSIDSYWDNIRENRDSLTRFGKISGAKGTDDGSHCYVPVAGILPGYRNFDAGFFGISERQAATMDPQHRLFLECCWHALEDAGLSGARKRLRIGVFGGAGGIISSYYANNLAAIGGLGRSASMEHVCNDKDFLCTNVSYRLNLTGPSISVQTACSTSLVAIHLACQSLRTGECDVALAGGVTVRVPHNAGYNYREDSILSRDGCCRPFDKDATGTVFTSGVGVVAFMRTGEAIKGQRSPLALVRGSAVNNDGSGKLSFWSSSAEGQSKAIWAAHRAANIDPAAIGLIEAHGTGTIVGDPLEVAALQSVYPATKNAKCALGSVKGNIGHCEAAAGVASLIKAVLCLRNKVIAPSGNFAQANHNIHFDESGFYIPRAARSWEKQGSTPRLAAVNALGVGGTNAYVIVEEASPQKYARSGSRVACDLYKISAPSHEGSKRLAGLWAHYINNCSSDLPVLCQASLVREQFDLSVIWRVRTKKELVAKLESHAGLNQAVAAGPRRTWIAYIDGLNLDEQTIKELADAFPSFRENLRQFTKIETSSFRTDVGQDPSKREDGAPADLAPQLAFWMLMQRLCGTPAMIIKAHSADVIVEILTRITPWRISAFDTPAGAPAFAGSPVVDAENMPVRPRNTVVISMKDTAALASMDSLRVYYQQGATTVCDLWDFVAKLHDAGLRPDLSCLGAGRTDLPLYPFEQREWWVSENPADWEKERADDIKVNRDQYARNFRYSEKESEIIQDHKLFDSIVVPAAAHIVHVCRAFMDRADAGYAMADLRFPEALVPDGPITMCTGVLAKGESGDIELSTRTFADGSDVGTKRIHLLGREVPTASKNIEEEALADQKLSDEEPKEQVYKALEAVGYNLGPLFQHIEWLRCTQRKNFSAGIRLAQRNHAEWTTLHPGVIDSILQACIRTYINGVRLINGTIWVPYSIKYAWFTRESSRSANAVVLGWSSMAEDGTVTAHLKLMDAEGRALVHLQGVEFRRVARSDLVGIKTDSHLYIEKWVSVNRTEEMAIQTGVKNASGMAGLAQSANQRAIHRIDYMKDCREPSAELSLVCAGCRRAADAAVESGGAVAFVHRVPQVSTELENGMLVGILAFVRTLQRERPALQLRQVIVDDQVDEAELRKELTLRGPGICDLRAGLRRTRMLVSGTSIPRGQVPSLSIEDVVLVVGAPPSATTKLTELFAENGARRILIVPRASADRGNIRDEQSCGSQCAAHMAIADFELTSLAAGNVDYKKLGAITCLVYWNPGFCQSGQPSGKDEWARLLAEVSSVTKLVEKCNIPVAIAISSIATSLGAPGFAQNAAAAGFIDGFWDSQSTSARRFVRLSVGPWEGAEAILRNEIAQTIGVRQIETRDVFRALTFVLDRTPPLTVYASLKKEHLEDNTDTIHRAELTKDELLSGLLAIARKHLGGDECIDGKTVLSRVGVDSLTALDIRTDMMATYGIEPSISELLGNKPANEIVAGWNSNVASSVNDQSETDSLSEEETAALATFNQNRQNDGT